MISTVVGVHDGAVATTALRSKPNEHGARFVKAFLDSFGCDKGDSKTGKEVSIISMAEKVDAVSSRLVTKLRTRCFYARQDLGSRERMHQTIPGQLQVV